MGLFACACNPGALTDPESDSAGPRQPRSRERGKRSRPESAPAESGQQQSQPSPSEPVTRKTVAFSASTNGMLELSSQPAASQARSAAAGAGASASAASQAGPSGRVPRQLSRTNNGDASTDGGSRSLWASNASVGNASNSSRMTKNCSYTCRTSLGDAEDDEDWPPGAANPAAGAPGASGAGAGAGSRRFKSDFDPLEDDEGAPSGNGTDGGGSARGQRPPQARGLAGVREEQEEGGRDDDTEPPFSDYDDADDEAEDEEAEDDGPSGTKRSTSTWSVKVMAQLQLVPDRDGRLRLPSILMFTQPRPPRETRTQAWWTKIRGVLVDVGNGLAGGGGGGGGGGPFSRAASRSASRVASNTTTTTTAASRVWSRVRSVGGKAGEVSRSQSLAARSEAGAGVGYEAPGALPGSAPSASTAAPAAPAAAASGQPPPQGGWQRPEPRLTQGGAPPSALATATAIVTVVSPSGPGGVSSKKLAAVAPEGCSHGGGGGGPPRKSGSLMRTTASAAAAPPGTCSAASRRPSSTGSAAGRRSGSGRLGANGANGGGGDGMGRAGSGRVGPLSGPQSEPLQRAAGWTSAHEGEAGRQITGRISDDGPAPTPALVSAGRGVVTPPRSPLLGPPQSHARNAAHQLPPLSPSLSPLPSPPPPPATLTRTPTEDVRRCSAVGDTLSPRPGSPAQGTCRPYPDGGPDGSSGVYGLERVPGAVGPGGPVAEELEWSRCYRHLPGRVDRCSVPDEPV